MGYNVCTARYAGYVGSVASMGARMHCLARHVAGMRAGIDVREREDPSQRERGGLGA